MHYDFASSLCYVAHRVMGRMRAYTDELGLDLVWTPVDLTRLTGWRRGAPVDADRMTDIHGIAAALDVSIKIPNRWLDSRRAHAIALCLADRPAEAASWRERLFSALYEEAWIHETDDELSRLCRDLGIELFPDRTERALTELELRTGLAREKEVTGVPTFMLGDWPFGGIQDESTMRSVLRRWATRQRQSD